MIETSPEQKYLTSYTKPNVQEVALIKAVADAKIKTSQTLWKEVVAQMKESTGEEFAAPSLRKRYEDIEKRQFYLSEQNPAKDSEWPPLPGVSSNGVRILFRNTPELVPISIGNKNMNARSLDRGNRDMSENISINSMNADKVVEDADSFKTITPTNGPEPASLFLSDKSKVRGLSSSKHSTAENENESPSHSHPRVSYGSVDYAREMASDRPMRMKMDPSTPTPLTTVGAALMGTGVGRGFRAGPCPGLVRYGDSDDSD